MDANQARIKAKSVIEDMQNSQIQQIETSIENAVLKGLFSINYYSSTRAYVIEHFKSLGYRIEKLNSNPGEHEYEISWKDANP